MNTAQGYRFPINSLMWFKERYMADSQLILNNYFTPEQISEIKQHAQDVQGDPNLNKIWEITYAWNNFVKCDRRTRSKIKSDYDAAKKQHNDAF